MAGLPISLAVVALAASTAAGTGETLPAGIWSNAEDIHFAEEEGRVAAPALFIEVAEDGRWRPLDAFGSPLGEWTADPVPQLVRRADGGWQAAGTELRRARPFSCWVAVRKFAGKPDGSADWSFTRGLATFDQGGRVRISGGGVAPDVTIRLRNVTWARGSSNNPALVLYVHKDDPDRAESYSWTSPEASRVGINLRWVQASCALSQPGG